MTEAFAAGWRANMKMTDKKKKVVDGSKPRREKTIPAKTGGVRGDPGSQTSDDRKAKSRCAGCGQLGHWKGIPKCPNVISGEEQLFVPKDSRAGRTVHWVGIVAVLPSGEEQGEHEDGERGGDEKGESSDSEEAVCRIMTSNKKGK